MALGFFSYCLYNMNKKADDPDLSLRFASYTPSKLVAGPHLPTHNRKVLFANKIVVRD